MAEHGSHHERGQMVIREQEQTFGLFLGMTKWGSLAAAALVLFLTLWFCTATGFLGAAIAAVALIAIGVMVLKAKPEASAAH
jgi:hypothetical protein